MKKRKIYMGLLFIAILAFSVVFIQLNMDANSKVEKGKDVDAITDSHEKIEKMLGEMTLEEKVGQLMMVGFRGTEKSSEITELIEQKHIGGVIYFDRNMKSPEQVAKLSNSLQQTADQSTLSLPLMVAVDQEGGNIIRMRERVSPLPSQQDLGKNASVEDMYKVAKLNGAELGSMGININFAPVLDLSKTDERSLGKDPEKVYQYGKKAIQGLNDVSITGALKHFPGNGRSEIDPHVETSSVEANQLDLENSDIYPFKQIISEMDNQKFFVMVTHIKYPAYDKEKPASLSKVIIEDLLRGKLKYEGLVVTDDLEMGAVNKYFSYEDMGKQAILAGADLLLVCHEYSHELEVYNGLLKAAKTGEVPMDRINESVKRVLTYKLFNMKQTKADPDQAEKVVKSPESMNYIESLNLDK
ncbi:beta-N-acetylhexosaminidase [Peribacillus sp. B2I2]|uniref:beta-N-acetylhexosaminidase n=1 Tax=Peribacillus sp. B2I2 TaxID=3156468 RepID=UPI003517C034